MKTSDEYNSIRAIKWEDNSLILLDQRELPHNESYLKISHSIDVGLAIRDMVVRGAPAIGIAAAYGYVLAVHEEYVKSPKCWRENIKSKVSILLSSRPTAVNLKWALQRLEQKLENIDGDPRPVALNEAHAIGSEDYSANVAMGKYGAEYIQRCAGVLTHCNTGSLATGGFGTALGVIRTLSERGDIDAVYVSETRPWLQGSRLTVWELERDNIHSTLIADSTAATLMCAGKINWVIIGADRVAANGDVANKIGSYSHAVNANFHGVKFMVVAPVSTIDLHTPSGTEIEIEDRDGLELISVSGVPITTKNVQTYNPVFDITPAELISVLVTEQGVIEGPNEVKIKAFLGTN